MIYPGKGKYDAMAFLVLMSVLTFALPMDFVSSANGAMISSWARAFGGNGFDFATMAKETSDGGFVVAGYSDSRTPGIFDVWILKLDSDGKAQWQKTYNSESSGYTHSILQLSDGGFMVAAHASGAWILKLDPTGQIRWQKAYTGIAALSMEQVPDGGFVIAGGGVLRLDPSGNVLWLKHYGGTAYSALPTSDGGFMVVGDSANFLSVSDAWVLKLDPAGNVAWHANYGGPEDDRARSVVQTPDGGYVVAGSTASFRGGFTDVWVFKLDALGNIIWQKAYGGPGFSQGISIRLTSDGGFVVGGYTSAFGAGLESGTNDGWILKLDSVGRIVWQRTYGGKGYEAISSVEQTADGGFIAANCTPTFGPGGCDAWVLRLDSAGNIPHCRITKPSEAVVTDTGAVIATTSITSANATSAVSTPSASVLDAFTGEKVQCIAH